MLGSTFPKMVVEMFNFTILATNFDVTIINSTDSRADSEQQKICVLGRLEFIKLLLLLKIDLYLKF